MNGPSNIRNAQEHPPQNRLATTNVCVQPARTNDVAIKESVFECSVATRGSPPCSGLSQSPRSTLIRILPSASTASKSGVPANHANEREFQLGPIRAQRSRTNSSSHQLATARRLWAKCSCVGKRCKRSKNESDRASIATAIHQHPSPREIGKSSAPSIRCSGDDSAPKWFAVASANDPHHGVAGVDVDFKIRWPPPLPCMRWFFDFICGFVIVCRTLC